MLLSERVGPSWLDYRSASQSIHVLICHRMTSESTWLCSRASLLEWTHHAGVSAILTTPFLPTASCPWFLCYFSHVLLSIKLQRYVIFISLFEPSQGTPHSRKQSYMQSSLQACGVASVSETHVKNKCSPVPFGRGFVQFLISA